MLRLLPYTDLLVVVLFKYNSVFLLCKFISIFKHRYLWQFRPSSIPSTHENGTFLLKSIVYKIYVLIWRLVQFLGLLKAYYISTNGRPVHSIAKIDFFEKNSVTVQLLREEYPFTYPPLSIAGNPRQFRRKAVPNAIYNCPAGLEFDVERVTCGCLGSDLLGGSIGPGG